MADQYDGYGYCCCDPCTSTTIDFEDGLFTVDGVPVSLTAGWSIDSGVLVWEGPGIGSLTWTVTSESKSTPFYLRIEADVLDLSGDSGGIFVYVGTKLVSLYKSNSDDIVLAYGTRTKILGTYNGSGTRCALQITPTECGTSIGYYVENNIDDSIRTSEIEIADFGLETDDRHMGVLALSPATTGDGCGATILSLTGDTDPFEDGGSCEEDPRSVTTSGTTVSRSTADLDCYFGAGSTPAYYWLIALTDVLDISDGYINGLDLLIWCTGSTLNVDLIDSATGCASDGGAGIVIQNLTWNSTTGVGRFEVYTNRTECNGQDGVTLWVDIQASIVSSGTGNRFDNVVMYACGTLPTGDCPWDDGTVYPCEWEYPGIPLPVLSPVYKLEDVFVGGGTGLYLVFRGWPSCFQSGSPTLLGGGGCAITYTLFPNNGNLDEFYPPVSLPCDIDVWYFLNHGGPYLAATVGYDSTTSEYVFYIYNIVPGSTVYEYRVSLASGATGFLSAFTIGPYDLTPKALFEE
jgi:hypothetical protein